MSRSFDSLRIRLRSGVARLHHALLLPLEMRGGRTPLLVFQMGKVGSRTVVESLQRLRLPGPVYHVHHLSREGLETDRRRTLARGMAPGGHYWAGRHLRRKLHRGQWRIITLVREPLGRNVSAFFHTLDLFCPEAVGLRNETATDAVLEQIKDAFLRRFPHEIPLTWLDEELKACCGIDVYSEPFHTEKGYQRYESNNIQALLIRLEDLDRCGPQALSDFLDIDSVALVKANVGGEKAYARLYRQFVGRVRFPVDFVNRIYDSRYARHFYTESEIAAFRSKWGEPAATRQIAKTEDGGASSSTLKDKDASCQD